MKIYLLTILTSLQFLVASANENPTPQGQGNSSPKNEQKRKAASKGNPVNNGLQPILDQYGQDIHPLTLDKKMNRVEVANINANEIYEYSFDGFNSIAGIVDGKYIHLPKNSANLNSVMVRKVGSTVGTSAMFMAGCSGSYFMNATTSQVCDYLNVNNPTKMDFNGAILFGIPNQTYTFKLRLLTTVIQTVTATTDGSGSAAFLFTNIDPDAGNQNYQLEVDIPAGPNACNLFPAASNLINCRAKIEITAPFGGPYCHLDAINFTSSRTETPTLFDAVSSATGMSGVTFDTGTGIFSATAVNATGAGITSNLSFTARYTDGTESCPTTVTAPALINSIPNISAQPVDITVCEDSPASFSITASGGSINYQWKEGVTNVGLNQNNYTTPNRLDIHNGFGYSVVLSNGCTVPTHPTNPQVTSSTAILTVNPRIVSVDAGADVTVCYNPIPNVAIGAAVLRSNGSSYNFGTWTTSGDGTFGLNTDINTTYTPGVNDRNSTVTLTWTTGDPDGAGPCGILSDTKDILFKDVPVATDPADETICSGVVPLTTISSTGNGTLLKYSGVALPATVIGIQTQTGLASGSAVNAATALVNSSTTVPSVVTYTVQPYNVGPNGIDDGATGDDCLGVSFTVNVTVQPSFIVGVLTQNPGAACPNSSATFEIDGLPSGVTATDGYEVSYSINGIPETPVNMSVVSATTSSFQTRTVLNADDNLNITVTKIKNLTTGCETVVSLSNTLDVNTIDPGTITNNSLPALACDAYDPAAGALAVNNVVTEPGTSSVTYLWQYRNATTPNPSYPDYDQANAAGVTGESISVDLNTTNEKGVNEFRMRVRAVKGGQTCDNYTAPVSITINEQVSQPVITRSKLVVCKDETVNLSIPALSGGQGVAPIISWDATDDIFGFPNDANWSNAAGNVISFTTPMLTEDMHYRVKITNTAGLGCFDINTWDEVLLPFTNVDYAVQVNNITEQTIVTTTPSCSDTQIDISPGSATGDGDVTQQWYVKQDAGAFSAVPGPIGTATDYSDPAGFHNNTNNPVTLTFHRVSTSTTSTPLFLAASVCDVTTNDDVVVVMPIPTSTNTTPADITICSGAVPSTAFASTAVGTLFKTTAAVTPLPNTITGITLQTGVASGTINSGVALSNSSNIPKTVTYTVTPYNVGPDGVDDDASGDDCLGTPYTVVVVVSPNISFTTVVQSPSAACTGTPGTFMVNDLPSGLTAANGYQVTYTINGGAPQIVNLTAVNPTLSTFQSINLQNVDDGTNLEITSIKDLATNCIVNFTGKTALIDVNQITPGTINNVSLATLACDAYDPAAGALVGVGSVTEPSGVTSYLWEHSTVSAIAGFAPANADGGSGNTTSVNLNTINTQGQNWYRLRVSNLKDGVTCTAYTPTVDISINAQVAQPIVTHDKVVCEGITANLSIPALNPAQGVGATISWDAADDDGFGVPNDATWANTRGNFTAITSDALTNDKHFRVKITNTPGLGCNDINTWNDANLLLPTNVDYLVVVNNITEQTISTTSPVCSDDFIDISPGQAFGDGTITQQWFVKQGAGAYAPAVPALPNLGTDVDYFDADGINNVTNAPITYTFKRTSTSSMTVGGTPSMCQITSNEEVVVVNPEPVTADITINTVCSDVAIGQNLPASTSGATTTTYNVTAVNVNGLTPAPGNLNVLTAFGVLNTAIAADVYTNLTSAIVNVVYTVEPVSSDLCIGTPFTVTVPISPEPVGSAGTTSTCSDVAIDYNLQGQITNGLTGVK
ncbi:MAG: PKD-like domain-containing protein, partial [Saprospiraceae bacterium]